MRYISGWVESLPLTNMRYISGWVESKVLCHLAGDFLFLEDDIKRAGFYLIKDRFFEEMQEPYLKGNKKENRPHYYCFEDKEGFYWMIPLSSRVDKYKNIMSKKIAANKPCDILHIANLGVGKESVFLIQDIFPITEEYIEREYTVAGIPFVMRNEKVIAIIERKAKNIIKLLKRGIKINPTQPNVLAILEKLKDK